MTKTFDTSTLKGLKAAERFKASLENRFNKVMTVLVGLSKVQISGSDPIGKRASVSCDQCEMISINGLACHEHGCPNRDARWDTKSREWIRQRKCFDCGYDVDLGDPCCGESCA